ncbi:DUF1145 domain-containing protein [Celerinatantimonas sp. YJH-8]|uniref:DUF1145 domain-containing protein n=1 Tax=Celerinatantimonas sp. YJH-8 TaxID=3228714 RepID=UPI0038BF7E7B
MFILAGKILMAIIWLMIVSSPWTRLAPIAPLMLAGGCMVILLHAVQIFLMKKVLKQSGHWQSGDGIQLLFFGVFALMTLRQRLNAHNA